MSRANIPFLAFNRGILGPKSLARVDLDRTRLSAEVCTNFMLATQGSMSLRPGTKYFGSSLRDTGAEFIEFIASTDDVALLELTNDSGSGEGTMRIWMGDDAHALSLLGRPAVDTTVSLSDTGWSDNSIGGDAATSVTPSDAIPTMTSATTDGVTISAGAQETNKEAFRAADDNIFTPWETNTSDTGLWWWKVDFGAGNAKRIKTHTLRAFDSPSLSKMVSAWTLQGNDVDTGNGWTTEVTVSGQTGWAFLERRSFEDTGYTDTGANSWRYWRIQPSANNGGSELSVAEIELLEGPPPSGQVQFNAQGVILNATSIGATAVAQKRVVVSDTGTEHSLDIEVERGPVVLRVGSTEGDDDYISETAIGTGYHNLSFTPQGNFHITLQVSGLVERIVSSLSIGDSGTVEIRTPWAANNLDNIRYDQSADVVYVDCNGVRPQKIERRGTGRSWSVVDYAPDDGPFLSSPSSSAKLSVSHSYGNTTLNSDIPVFRSGHVGSLVRIFHEGQSGVWPLGALDAKTDAVTVTGIGDTGTAGATNERRIRIAATGTWVGTLTIERSFDGPDIGFKQVTDNLADGTHTSNFDTGIDDTEDNIEVYYRARFTSYTSGAAFVSITYGGGGITGRARITGYNSNTDVDIEVLSRFSDTGASDNWQLGYWSDARGFPSAVQLHGGRLGHAQGGSMFLSASDNFESFDVNTEGDAAPIIRTLGSGPVDNIHYMVSVLRLLIGTAGSELAVRSSSLDEPLTPDNASAIPFSTQGSANIRAVKLDTRALMVQRSKQRVFSIGPAQNTLADYEGFELTQLVPDLLAAGIVSIAVQRQPDTRLHCVLGDGSAGILTYEPNEEVIAWQMWEGDTGTAPQVERAMVLPGIEEDAVYYHIKRTINGAHKRYLEKWAKESECLGDTGLSWLMDCAVSFAADTGRATTFVDAATHLAGESVVAWGDLDTGSTPYVDLSPGIGSLQTRYSIDTGGDLTLTGYTDGVSQGVLGLPYKATWKSSKLAYGAEMGSALAQSKRVPQAGLILYKTHQSGIQYGARDTGNLDSLPGRINGKVVDPDTIHETLDQIAVPIPATYESDPRLILRASSPRAATILSVVPTVVTSEK